MSGSYEAAKLARLRARRDRELIAIVARALERGCDLLRRHANGGTVGQHLAEAERAHAEAAKLLALVYDLSEPERRRLDMRLAELRSALDGAAGRQETQLPQA